MCMNMYTHTNIYVGHHHSVSSSAQEWRNRTVAEHACSKMEILCFTKTK